MLAVLTLGGGCPTPEPEPAPEPTPIPAPAGPLASDVALTLVTVNQGVAVPVISEGVLVDARNAPIVAGRPGLLRVFVTPLNDFEERELVAELTLWNGGAPEVLRETVPVEESSLSADLDTTFNFDLPASMFTSQTRFSVAVREVDGTPRTEVEGPTWPLITTDSAPSADLGDAYDLGSADMRVSDWGAVVRVHIIPVRYDSDGSGRMPDTSDEQIELLRSVMLRIYPVREVIIEVGEVYPTSIPFDSSSEPMSDLLQEVVTLREDRGIPFDTYAYAMVNPAETRQEYCQSGCTLGIAYRVGNPNSDHLRSGVGVGYTGSETADTLAHEVGHNHNRGHAPCGGAGNVDADYPYANGGTGVWGWDIVNGELKDPSEYADVMGYCSPNWISDYQFDQLWRRTAAIEGLASSWEGEVTDAWQLVSLRPGGRSKLAQTARLTVPPDGETSIVRLIDAHGVEVGKSTGYAVTIEDAGPGVGTLFLPALADNVTAVELPGGQRLLR